MDCKTGLHLDQHFGIIILQIEIMIKSSNKGEM